MDQVTATDWVALLSNNPAFYFTFEEKGYIDRVIIRARDGAGEGAQGPSDFTIEGSNTGAFGGEETTLDTQTNETFTDGQSKVYDFSNANAYKFYRINITDTDQGSYVGWREVEVWDRQNRTFTSEFASFSADLTSGETFDSESEYSGSYLDDYAFDDDAGSEWASANTAVEHWIEVEFGTAQEINKITIQARDTSQASADQCPRTFTIEASATGAWGGEEVVIATYKAYDCWGISEKRTQIFANSTAYKWWRISSTNQKSGNITGIAEIEMMTGTEVTTAPPTTLAPTTLAPTTLAPTTLAPTTAAPTTLAPTTTLTTCPPADYETDFSEYGTGTALDAGDWTDRWDADLHTEIVEGAGWIRGKAVEFHSDSAGRQAVSWDDPGTVHHGEILVLQDPKLISDYTHRVIFRGGGSGATEEGYFFEMMNAVNWCRLAKYTSGSYTAMTSWKPSGVVAGSLVYVRIRFWGNSIKCKVWQKSQSEPAGWDVEITDSDHTSGWVGIGHNDTNESYEGQMDFFSVGICPNNPPPTAPPSTPSPTTLAPTTAAPTTLAPTTLAPTTVAPTTVAPTTVAPTTLAPTTYNEDCPACEDNFTGSNGDPPNGRKWVIENGSPDIQSNQLEMYTSGGSGNGEIVKSRCVLTGDFDVVVYFDFSSGEPDSNSYNASLEFRIDDTHKCYVAANYFWGRAWQTGFIDGGGWTYRSDPRTNTYGALRMVRSGNSFTPYQRDGTGNWTQVDLGWNCGSSNDPCEIRLSIGSWDGDPAATVRFDDFDIFDDCPLTTVVPTTLGPTTTATTSAPTTLAPTTLAPTTLAPTTLAPTTLAPTTLAPTTLPPTTLAPTTLAPTTLAPTTLAPTTSAPTTSAPTTAAPTTAAPTSAAPTTVAPTTIVTTVSPSSAPPTTAVPTTAGPTTVAPTTVAPTSLAPTTLLTTLAPTTTWVCEKSADTDMVLEATAVSKMVTEQSADSDIVLEIEYHGNICW
jgi:hypothetical protein